jgi:hypothetical protein
MLRFARTAAAWVGRHAFPVMAAGVIAIGAAGGGIGYALASQHSTAAPAASAPSRTPSASAPKGLKPTTAGVASLVQRALAMLASQTGQSVAAVRSQLAAGKSVDTIAGSKAPAIETEILSAITKLADRGVTSHRITATQEATDLALAKTKVEALMAEPGTQLVKDAQRALQFLQTHGHKAAGPTAHASPAPAA